MKRLILLLAALCLAGCTARLPASSNSHPLLSKEPILRPAEDPVPETISPRDPLIDIVDNMTTEEKVGQLILARYHAGRAVNDLQQYHLGGWILFSGDFKNQTPDSIRSQIGDLQSASPIGLLMAVDEEGGTVTRISRHPQFREKKFNSPRYLYGKGGEELLIQTEKEKSELLSSLGLNVNMGPVCDITTDPCAFMYRRSLGQSPAVTGRLIAAMVQVMEKNHVGTVLKHFPGYGNNDDTHVGIARDSRSLQALEAADLVPFQAGINAGCSAILVSHTIVEALDNALPASLSPAVIVYLRESMGFDGVVITDDLAMQAITDTYGTGDAAIMAVQAGCDLLCSTEYVTQYDAVLAAVREGRIPMERIDEAVYRILRWKQELGLILP